MTDHNTQETRNRAVLVGLNADSLPREDNASETTLEELAALVETAGGESVGIILQNRDTPEARTFIGEGKVAEVTDLVHAQEADLVVFDNELSDIPQGNITYRWFKCAGLGSGAQLVAKELGSSPSLSLSGLQGSCINCEVTLTVNGKSKTFVPKAICNGKLSDGIYVRPRIG